MGFLTPTEQNYIDYLFDYKTVIKWKRDEGIISQKCKKSLIPIGINELQIKTLEWTKTKRSGEKMLHFQIWKNPEYLVVEDKDKKRSVGKTVSFDYINCYHLISDTKRYNLNERWFFPVGRFYTEDQLNMLIKMKNKKFKALVKHIEQEFNTHFFIKAEIIHVYKNDEQIDYDSINYVKLYERLKI